MARKPQIVLSSLDLDRIEALLAAMPSLSGPLSILVWVIWAVGAFFIVLLGVIGSGLIVHFGRKAQPRLPAQLRLG